jgi:Barstar (barnase inhibitor)
MTDQLMTVDDAFHPLLLAGDQEVVGSAILGWSESGLTARMVRGRKMRTRQGLFDEFASAFQFPLYFGENEDAFNECIAELEGLPPGAGYVVVITEPDQVLGDAGGDALAWLTRSLAVAAEEWSQPIELGESWDRPAVPFHIVLAGPNDVLLAAQQRWSSAGAQPRPLGGTDR